MLSLPSQDLNQNLEKNDSEEVSEKVIRKNKVASCLYHRVQLAKYISYECYLKTTTTKYCS